MEEQLSRKIIKEVASRKMTKYVQAVELISFMLVGLFFGLLFGLKDGSFLGGALIFFFIGITLAIVAGESAIEEYKMDVKNG